jgi:hypothetical protein
LAVFGALPGKRFALFKINGYPRFLTTADQRHAVFVNRPHRGCTVYRREFVSASQGSGLYHSTADNSRDGSPQRGGGGASVFVFAFIFHSC